jgi:hypothetical protein
MISSPMRHGVIRNPFYALRSVPSQSCLPLARKADRHIVSQKFAKSKALHAHTIVAN